MARGSFSTPMTEDTIVEFDTVMKLLSLMNINSERKSDSAKREVDWGSYARFSEWPGTGIWNLYREYAGGGRVIEMTGANRPCYFVVTQKTTGYTGGREEL